MSLVGLALVLALALPAAASAQVLDPTLEQYAPSTQQINKQVEGGGDGGQDEQGGNGGQVEGGGDGGQDEQGDGAGTPAGGQGGGQGGGGGGAPAGGQGGGRGAPASAPSSGLDERVVGTLPLTRFDLIAMFLAAVAITGTAVVLRRLSRTPRVGD